MMQGALAFLALTEYASGKKYNFFLHGVHLYYQEPGAPFTVITTFFPGAHGVLQHELKIKESVEELEYKMKQLMLRDIQAAAQIGKRLRDDGEHWRDDDDDDDFLQGFHVSL